MTDTLTAAQLKLLREIVAVVKMLQLQINETGGFRVTDPHAARLDRLVRRLEIEVLGK